MPVEHNQCRQSYYTSWSKMYTLSYRDYCINGTTVSMKKETPCFSSGYVIKITIVVGKCIDIET